MTQYNLSLQPWFFLVPVSLMNLLLPSNPYSMGLNFVCWPLTTVWAAAHAQDLRGLGLRWPVASVFCMLMPFFVAATLWDQLSMEIPVLGVSMLACYLAGSHRLLNDKITGLDTLGLVTVATGQSIGALGTNCWLWALPLAVLIGVLTLAFFNALLRVTSPSETQADLQGVNRL